MDIRELVDCSLPLSAVAGAGLRVHQYCTDSHSFIENSIQYTMKTPLIISSILAASATVLAAPAPGSPLKQRLASLLSERSGYLPQSHDISLSSSFSRRPNSVYPLAHTGEITGQPITVKFGSSQQRHRKLPKKKTKNTDGSNDHHDKRQDQAAGDQTELLNFDDTRYIACEFD